MLDIFSIVGIRSIHRIVFLTQIIHFCDKRPPSPWHTLILYRLTAPFVRVTVPSGRAPVPSVGPQPGGWCWALLSDQCRQQRPSTGQLTPAARPAAAELL